VEVDEHEVCLVGRLDTEACELHLRFVICDHDKVKYHGTKIYDSWWASSKTETLHPMRSQCVFHT
jgi:hypothetical protein